jgi:hypothetical protein
MALKSMPCKTEFDSGTGFFTLGGAGGGGGGGTVTSVSITTANGVSGVVINPYTAVQITLTLGDITPTSVAATGTVTGSNLSGTNTGDQTITLTGDVTGSGTGSFSATIASAAVTNAKLANVSTATIKGRISASTGSPEDLTGTQATTLFDTFTSALKGLVPASGGGTANFLRADGTWVAPAGSGTVTTVSVVTANGVSGTVANATSTPAITLTLGAITPSSVAATGTVTGSNLSGTHTGSSSGTNTGDQTITLTGNVTGTGTGSFATTIAAGVVTNSMLANVSTATIKGRTTAGAGSPEDLTGTQATALLDTFTSSLKGLAPSSGGGTTNFLRADGSWAAPVNGGGTVTTVSVVTANGVSGSVATATTTPAITLTLGAITPTSVAATGTVTGSNLSGTHSGSSSGTNTGDQTISITGDVTASGSTGALTATVTKVNGVLLSALATGIVKNTTSTGVLSIAVAADFPTLNQNTTGTAANVTGTVAVANGGTGGTTAGTARTNLGLVIGTDVLAPNGSGASLTGITATQVGLGNVSNDVQTKAAIVPNTLPSAGQLLIGNAGGTAYAPLSMSGDVTITSAGVTAIGSSKVTNTMLAGSIDLTTKVTGALPVANGGTGATTSASAATNLGLGTSNSVTFSSVSDTNGNVRSIPQNAKTAAYVLVASDSGKHISITTGGITVNASVFSTGDVVTIYNNSTSSQTITQGTSVTLRQGGTANTGNRTLAQYGVCTILCVASNTFVITGTGLT